MITGVPAVIRQIFEIYGIAGYRVPRKFWVLIKYRPEMAFCRNIPSNEKKIPIPWIKNFRDIP